MQRKVGSSKERSGSLSTTMMTTMSRLFLLVALTLSLMGGHARNHRGSTLPSRRRELQPNNGATPKMTAKKEEKATKDDNFPVAAPVFPPVFSPVYLAPPPPQNNGQMVTSSAATPVAAPVFFPVAISPSPPRNSNNNAGGSTAAADDAAAADVATASPVWSPTAYGYYAPVAPPPPLATSSSQSALQQNSWILPTIIFGVAAILIILLLVYMAGRRDVEDTDSEWESDSEYSFRPGERRKPTTNHYAETLKSIGRNNSRFMSWKRPGDAKSVESNMSPDDPNNNISSNKSVKFLKPALKSGKMPVRHSFAGVEPLSEVDSVYPASIKSVGTETDASQVAAKQATTGFCAMPNLFGWNNNNDNNSKGSKNNNKKKANKQRVEYQEQTLRRLSKDERHQLELLQLQQQQKLELEQLQKQLPPTHPPAEPQLKKQRSTKRQSEKDSNRARELMRRLQKEKEVQRKVQKERKKRLEEMEERPNVYRKRSEFSETTTLQDMPHTPSGVSNGTSLYTANDPSTNLAYTYSDETGTEISNPPHYRRYG